MEAKRWKIRRDKRGENEEKFNILIQHLYLFSHFSNFLINGEAERERLNCANLAHNDTCYDNTLLARLSSRHRGCCYVLI